MPAERQKHRTRRGESANQIDLADSAIQVDADRDVRRCRRVGARPDVAAPFKTFDRLESRRGSAARIRLAKSTRRSAGAYLRLSHAAADVRRIVAPGLASQVQSTEFAPISTVRRDRASPSQLETFTSPAPRFDEIRGPSAVQIELPLVDACRAQPCPRVSRRGCSRSSPLRRREKHSFNTDSMNASHQTSWDCSTPASLRRICTSAKCLRSRLVEIAFFDDSLETVNGAIAVGMHRHHVQRVRRPDGSACPPWHRTVSQPSIHFFRIGCIPRGAVSAFRRTM